MLQHTMFLSLSNLLSKMQLFLSYHIVSEVGALYYVWSLYLGILTKDESLVSKRFSKYLGVDNA